MRELDLAVLGNEVIDLGPGGRAMHSSRSYDET
jgi:hypothetical protein